MAPASAQAKMASKPACLLGPGLDSLRDQRDVAVKLVLVIPHALDLTIRTEANLVARGVGA